MQKSRWKSNREDRCVEWVESVESVGHGGRVGVRRELGRVVDHGGRVHGWWKDEPVWPRGSLSTSQSAVGERGVDVRCEVSCGVVHNSRGRDIQNGH